MDVVFFANAINAVGVFFGLMAHAYISFSQQIRKGHGFYLVSCVLIVVGSYLLSSWPVIALNVLFMVSCTPQILRLTKKYLV